MANKVLVYSILIFIFLVIMPYISNSRLEELQKIFQEVAYSYYMSEKYIQNHLTKDCFLQKI